MVTYYAGYATGRTQKNNPSHIEHDQISLTRSLLTDEIEISLLKFQSICPRLSPIEHLCRLRDTKTLNSFNDLVKNMCQTAYKARRKQVQALDEDEF